MTFILRTCALFLVLQWKLTCETTLTPGSARQHEDTSKENKQARGADNLTTFFPKYTEQPLKPNDETTNRQSSIISDQSTFTDYTPTIRAEVPTAFSPEFPKQNEKTTYIPSINSLQKGTSKDQETKMRTDEYITEDKKNDLSSETLPQTSDHQGDTSLSHEKYVSSAMTISTGESRSYLSSAPFSTEQPPKKTSLPQNMLEEAITRKGNDQTFYHFKSTNKGLDRVTKGNRTTRSAEKESFMSDMPQTDILTPFQNSPAVLTNQSGVEVQTTDTRTTKWSSPQEEENTQLPILESSGTLDISNEERNATATYTLNKSTTAAVSTGLGTTVYMAIGTSSTTDTMDINATFEITTKSIISERKSTVLTPNSESTPMTQTDNTKTTILKYPVQENKNKKRHPGTIVAYLIGSILFLMFLAIVVILVRNHQMKKKKMVNTDWAGPSPFIESGVQPNIPTVNEERLFYHSESKRISIHSFLPQRLSKRFTTSSPTDEEVPFEDIQVSSTFGHEYVQPLNGKANPVQIQTHDANGKSPQTPESDKKTEPEPPSDTEIVLSPPPETNSVTPTPFEDVALNTPVDKNTESTSPQDAILIPSPPPLPPS